MRNFKVFFAGLLLLATLIPLSGYAAYYYESYYPSYFPVYNYGAPTVVTYPAATTAGVVVSPTTTTTSTYWYGTTQPAYYNYNYGARPCYQNGETLVCW